MSRRPNAQAGPSKPSPAPARGPSRVIEKTTELLRRNGNGNGRGKGKGREKLVLGRVADMLEGSSSLPGSVMVERFAETRALEILALQNAIKSSAKLNSARVFQSLPRHLRRRAASHNPRRVPKRFRLRAAVEIDPSDKIAKLHRKKAKLLSRHKLSSKDRAKLLLSRQRDKKWLDTHVYHAKRFHMGNFWGYRIPLSPTLKSFRPAYRASRRRATVQDVSYYGIIELEGKRDDLVQLLGRMTEGAFAGQRYETGGRTAQTWLYRPGTFPLGLIGPADILWDSDDRSGYQRRLWIRVHPSIFEAIWKPLREEISTSSQPNEPLAALISMRDLRGDLGSFEITGPLAGTVLKRVLRLSKAESPEKQAFFRSLGNLHSTAELPEGLVVGFQVYDPRLNFPPPALPQETGTFNPAFTPSASLASSKIWDLDIDGDELKFKKSDLDRRRHELQLPGQRLRPTPADETLPLLLVQRSVGSGSSAVHGFTLLFPSKWSMPLLASLVYSSSVLIGLRERRVQYREAGLPHFPETWSVVTKASEEWERGQAVEEALRWMRKPPGKRPEWGTLGITSPWNPDWIAVMPMLADPGAQPWLVPSTFLQHIDQLVDGEHAILGKMISAFRHQRGLSDLPSVILDGLWGTALLHVKLEMVGRGSMGDMASIHTLVPGESDKLLGAQEDELDDQSMDPERLMGWVVDGNFSMIRGRGWGVGLVTLAKYVLVAKLAKQEGGEPLVKVKNRDGRVFRLAKVALA